MPSLNHSFVSISQLKAQPMQVFETAKQDDAVYVLKRSEPVGVIMSPEAYEQLTNAAKKGGSR